MNIIFEKIAIGLKNKRLLNWLPDKLFLKLFYWIFIKESLDLDNPKTFNEKLQWLKLYDKKPEYTKMVDKIDAKGFASSLIGDEYIVPTIATFDRFDDIDFDMLPNQFVIKCSHDSGGVVICKDKNSFDISSARNKINKCLKRNFYYHSREWVYKNIKPRILIEEYIGDDLDDYKLMCFDGKVKCSFVCLDRYSDSGLKVDFYDIDWNKMPFARAYPRSKKLTPKPENYDKMVELATKLSQNIPFVRIDFYEVDGKLYFGEMTFYPGSGFEPFYPKKWDKILGDWITLPNEQR